MKARGFNFLKVQCFQSHWFQNVSLHPLRLGIGPLPASLNIGEDVVGLGVPPAAVVAGAHRLARRHVGMVELDESLEASLEVAVKDTVGRRKLSGG